MKKVLCTLIAVAAGTAAATQTLAGEQPGKLDKPDLIMVDHMGGTLAVNLESVVSVFYLPGSPERPARFRLNFAGNENKAVDGPAAEPLWQSVREGPRARAFVWVSHMGGTLGIPVRNIQSVFKSGEGISMSVCINHPGDPDGKTVKGAEAAEVWKRLAQ
ncbi:MAG: hypothetical protein JXO72_03970 [Vicinamibacteria bacterium]|nr:hypothetical protein [Vicinamibacteria bacterium]